MKSQVSPWVRKTMTVYIAVVVIGVVFGFFFSGGTGAIWMLPLTLPWAAIDVILDEKMNGALFDSVWGAMTSTLVCAALNVGILYWILRRIDRSRLKHEEQDGKAPWVTIVPVIYALVLASCIAFGELTGERGKTASMSVILPLTFPWFFILVWVELALGLLKPFATGFWIEHFPDLIGGAINFCLLFLGLKLLDRRLRRKQSAAAVPQTELLK